MQNFTKEEFSQFEKVNSLGGFGTIYRNGDKIYKVYNSKVKTKDKHIVDNPMLEYEWFTIRKLNRLIKLRDRIKNSDLVEDTFCIDGYFAGSIMPYYENGITYEELKKRLPLEERIPLCRDVVTNSMELIDNNIYPLDQQTRNIMLVNGKCKFVDLDDYHIRVTLLTNLYYRLKAIDKVDMTIKDFLSEHFRSVVFNEITSLTTRQTYPWNRSFDSINHYIDDRSTEYDLLFVDGDFNLTDGNLIDNKRVILVYKGTHNDLDIQSVISKIHELNSRGIEVYEVILEKDMEQTIQNTVSNNALYVENNSVLVLK